MSSQEKIKNIYLAEKGDEHKPIPKFVPDVATTLLRKSKKKIIAGRTLNDIILNINEQKEY